MEKVLKKVITFNTTTDAIAFEKACKQSEIPGRLIPVPRIISASCGICWSSDAENAEVLNAFIEEKNLKHSGIYDMML